MKPEEKIGGFSTEDSSNIFKGKQAQSGNTNVQPEENAGKAPTGNRIKIDNPPVGSSYVPKYRKNNTFKWIVSIVFLFVIAIASTYFITKSLINPTGNGINKEITLITSEDGKADISQMSGDFGFNTDSILNALMKKYGSDSRIEENFKKKQDGKFYSLNILKDGKNFYLNTEIFQNGNKIKSFRRSIVLEGSDDKVNNQNSNSSQIQADVNPPISENQAAQQKTLRKVIVSDNGQQEEHSFVVPKESQKVVEKIGSKTEKEVASANISKDVERKKESQTYTWEEKLKNEKDKNINTSPNVPSKEQQYASQGPIYTIQVYSTPSLKDAQYWVKRLKDMNITTAYISTHEIRGKTWYRVRFGEFPTNEEAKAAAKRNGFESLWIDRVK
ncbi:MAG: hypothetical protein A2X64_03360 [Ignavibacteria bacterium GWF2_33_9]|nr:MAG: hypothetical protein A2X64_03360 [Ignavibacteria bacterium GWF2_33_9]